MSGGYGVPRNFAKALQWYQLAAKAGDREAQYSLGLMYLDGRGVARDEKTAADYFEQAAAARAERRDLQSRAPLSRRPGAAA